MKKLIAQLPADAVKYDDAAITRLRKQLAAQFEDTLCVVVLPPGVTLFEVEYEAYELS